MRTTTIMIIVALLLVSVLSPVASAWEKEVEHWSQFTNTYEENTGDIRYDETSTSHSAPSCIRMKNWATGWIETSGEDTISVTFWMKIREVNDLFFVAFCQGVDAQRIPTLYFSMEQQGSNHATLSINDRGDPESRWAQDATEMNFYQGGWVYIELGVMYKNSKGYASARATDSSGRVLEVPSLELYNPDTIQLTRNPFEWVKMYPPTNIVYVDDIKVTTWDDEELLNPLVKVPVVGDVGGVGAGLLLFGLLGIILGVGYWFNIIPLPSVQKGRLRIGKRRKT
jgi:hypothetical protein